MIEPQRPDAPLQDCYGCDGTGTSVWHRTIGKPCACLHRNDCDNCGEHSGVERDGDSKVYCAACDWEHLLDSTPGIHRLVRSTRKLSQLLAEHHGRPEL